MKSRASQQSQRDNTYKERRGPPLIILSTRVQILIGTDMHHASVHDLITRQCLTRGPRAEKWMRAARALPHASWVSIWTMLDFFFLCWSSVVITVNVEPWQSVSTSYFYSAFWPRGKDNDSSTCIILKGFFSLASALCLYRSGALLRCPIPCYPPQKWTF